jgi:hypothetical protein
LLSSPASASAAASFAYAGIVPVTMLVAVVLSETTVGEPNTTWFDAVGTDEDPKHVVFVNSLPR